ncbi:hypothetical protein EIN_059010 [Entamoeba invadens IP1]|uniref:hypothetical protein n=1 Tax=Entamoeba invadens IP1 TaxID=370355 RepID=UPI0002C3E202|nr:hypothetical protein EIN_059010 [Entamoeba invadens IP1]ELP93436.1 hypothetical protein EIN_059010 [Entamoeba invadens IP1]|eukprot:XP_004260207.1 hypothetical protein EIN_059010 [Entamoeba invadens IP1]
MEELLAKLSNVEYKSAQQIEAIFDDLNKIIKLSLDDTIVKIKKDDPLEILTTLYPKTELMLQNKRTILKSLHDFQLKVDDLAKSEQNEIGLIEDTQQQLLFQMEKQVRVAKDRYRDVRDDRRDDRREPSDKKPLRPLRDDDDRRSVHRNSPDYREPRFDLNNDRPRSESRDRNGEQRQDRAEQRERHKPSMIDVRKEIGKEIDNLVDGKIREELLVYDTKRDGWNMEKFVEKCNKKKGLVFGVFDTNKHVFGVSMSEAVVDGTWINDSKIFMFSYQPFSERELFFALLKQSIHDGTSIFKMGKKDEDMFFQVANVVYIQNKSGEKKSSLSQEMEEYFQRATAKLFCSHIYPDTFEPLRVFAIQM